MALRLAGEDVLLAEVSEEGEPTSPGMVEDDRQEYLICSNMSDNSVTFLPLHRRSLFDMSLQSTQEPTDITVEKIIVYSYKTRLIEDNDRRC